MRRTTARVGDVICVSGTIGDAALGLRMRLDPDADWVRMLEAASRDHLADRYLHPHPRLALAGAIRRFATAAMDVSDGLAGDLAKMMAGAGVTAAIDAAAVPLSSAASQAIDRQPDLFDLAVTGGDDYEILCTVGILPSTTRSVRPRAVAGVPVTAVGTVVAGGGPPAFWGERRHRAGLRGWRVQPFLRPFPRPSGSEPARWG